MKCKVGSKVRIISYEALINKPELGFSNRNLKPDDIRLGVVVEVDQNYATFINCNNGTTYPISTIEEVVEE